LVGADAGARRERHRGDGMTRLYRRPEDFAPRNLFQDLWLPALAGRSPRQSVAGFVAFGFSRKIENVPASNQECCRSALRWSTGRQRGVIELVLGNRVLTASV
jgi:hypothetical protein